MNRRALQNLSRISLLVIMALFILPLHAEQDKISCKNIESLSGPEASYCYGVSHAKQDRRLNNAYKKIMAIFSKHEEGLSDEDKKYAGSKVDANNLKIAQRAWITFRDKYCDFVVGENVGFGTGWQIRLKSCLSRVTKQRADELERYSANLSSASRKYHPELWK